MNTESTSAILNNGEPELPLRAAASGPTSTIICLKPAPALGSTLPKIDAANALVADPNVPVPQEIVTGLIHMLTTVLLASGSKAGKTWFLLALAMCISTGTRFLKWTTTRVKVLVVNLELHRVFMRQRLQHMMERLQVPNLDNLDFLNLRGHGLDSDTLLENLVDHIRGKGYGLIILDPFYKLMLGRSENTASGVGALCQMIERLSERTGAAVMYAHHFTKGNAANKKPIDRMSGSGVFARDADTIITLTEHVEDGCYVVEMTLRNFPPQPAFVVQWNCPIFVERPDLDPADLKRAEGEKAQDDLAPLLELLDQKPLTTGEWKKAAEAEGYTHASFYRKLSELRAANQVQRDRKDRTWSRAAVKPDSTANGATPDTAEINDSFDTFDTFETAETGIPSGQEVSSIKSIKSINTPGSSGGEVLVHEGGLPLPGEGPKEEGADCPDHAQSMLPSNLRP